MDAVVLAETDAWVYVGFAYGATVVLIGGYVISLVRRGRKVGRQVPADERRWS